MLLPEKPAIGADLKGADGSNVVPGFPTEGNRSLSSKESLRSSPVVVRRLSADDQAKVKGFSIENDSAGWLKKKLFKREVTWPRELYLKVLGCRGLVQGGFGAADAPTRVTKGCEPDGHRQGGEWSEYTDSEQDSEGSGSDNDTGTYAGKYAYDVRLVNATTDQDLHTNTVRDRGAPVFEEAFVIPCQGPRDAIVLEVYGGRDGGENHVMIGDSALPLDARYLGSSQAVSLELTGVDKKSAGFLRVEAFWIDEAKPRKENGDFYYKVVHPSGVRLRSQPSLAGQTNMHIMDYGEVFRASERQEHVGESDSRVFVKVLASADKWARGGWCFETRESENGKTEAVLQRVNPPRRQRGQFFYRVCAEEGCRLHSKAEKKSALRSEVIPKGCVLEANEKYTPAGSPVTFVSVDMGRGYIVERPGEKVKNESGGVDLEMVECPEGVVVTKTGDVEVAPPTLKPERGRSPTRNITNSAFVPRVYRARVDFGIPAVKTPDIVAQTADLLHKGQVFHANAEVVKRYEGIGEVAFLKRATDGLWIRANRPGAVLIDCFTDQTEAGAFTYRVAHENGVLVRTAPGLDAPPVKPKRILPVKKLINVCERLIRAEDMLEGCRPPTFLRLAGNDGWVFDRRGRTMVCEDVTAKSKLATANIITAEAARLALGP